MPEPDREFLVDLAGALATGQLVTDKDVLASYQSDQASWLTPGAAAAMVRASSAADVQGTLRLCNDRGIPVVARGAGSGLSGAANAIDHCVILDLSRMNRIIEIDPIERLATVEPGVLNGDLNGAAHEHGLWYPPDPASRAFSTIGGNIATNAGGLCCVKYGVTRDWVSSLEVVLADGRSITTRANTRKDVAGYDLTGLLVGSEGTLGIVTRAALRLRPPPQPAGTLVANFPSLTSAGDAVASTIRRTTPSLLEIIDRETLRAIDDWRRMELDRDAAAMLMIQADCPDPEHQAAELREIDTACRDAGATWSYLTTDPDESDLLLETRRSAYPALERLGAPLLDDVAVPLRQLSGFLQDVERIAHENDTPVFTFGHAGDGNLHPTLVVDPRDDAAKARALRTFDALLRAATARGGTVTGEHGVGVLKLRQTEAQLGVDALDVHRSIKNALDPRGILNPGKLIEAAR